MTFIRQATQQLVALSASHKKLEAEVHAGGGKGGDSGGGGGIFDLNQVDNLAKAVSQSTVQGGGQAANGLERVAGSGGSGMQQNQQQGVSSKTKVDAVWETEGDGAAVNVADGELPWLVKQRRHK